MTMLARHSPASTVSLPTLRRHIYSQPVCSCAANMFPSRRHQRVKRWHSIPVFRARIFCSARLRSPTGNGADAIADFQKEGDLDPLNGAVYERLGDTYIRAGDFDRAQQALNRAVLLEPNVNIPFILLGKVLLKQQNPSMAKMYLEHALEMDPKNYMAHYLLGQAYRALGRTDDAARESHAAEQIHAATRTALRISLAAFNYAISLPVLAAYRFASGRSYALYPCRGSGGR